MNIEVNTGFIFKIIGTLVTLGGLIWGLAEKFNDAEVERREIKAKLDMLLEERLAKMEKNELWKRMQEALRKNPSDESNYSSDRYFGNENDGNKPAEVK